MGAFFEGIHRTIVPVHDGDHGPLPPLLVALTVVTGLVDAFSYLRLGHVFVANMTGNVVFLGFALVGAKGFSITASLAALASFGLGAALGGKIARRTTGDRARHLVSCTVVQAVLLAVAVAVVLSAGAVLGPASRYPLIVVLGASMGVQNATARTLAVPDLTTTVLTMTIVGIAADSPGDVRTATSAGRRCVAVAAMFVGALVGAALIVHGQRALPLVLALVVVMSVGGTTAALSRARPAWARPGR